MPDAFFDVAVGNVPFGSYKLTDKRYDKHNFMIHNYFFAKALDQVRPGGIVAFITSQGVMNSPKNEPVRKWLMENASLVSAVRLPNNLFTDHAGTEVGSDLIILQKNSAKVLQTPDEQVFVKNRTLSSGENINNLFQNFDRVVHTKGYADTDPYGKPATVFVHEGGIPAMAADLRKMLSADFDRRLDKKLYLENAISVKPQVSVLQQSGFENPQEEQYGYHRKSTAQLDREENPVSLEDLIPDEEPEISYERKSTAQPDRKENSPGFDDLFSTEDFAGIKHGRATTQQITEEKELSVKAKEQSITAEPRIFVH
jgi:hypothetical protein